MKTIDKENLQKMIEERYISVQKHPTEDLYIYNYTQKAQFDKVWNNETLNCRCLIMDGKGNIIARPFSKFFNLEGAINNGEQLPLEDFEVFEKYDGSLGILYFIGDIPYLATRGSFISDQALRGTKMLREKYSGFKFNPGWSYLFEIIYPENRIVIDYDGMEDLVLLAMVNNETAEEADVDNHADSFPVRKRYDGITDYGKLKDLAESNKEGFVIRFKDGKRYKVKFDEYVRLHRLITGVNARRIWDLLRNKEPLDELLDRVPDEFFVWVRTTVENLKKEFEAIQLVVVGDFIKISTQLNLIYGDGAKSIDLKIQYRKEFADLAVKTKYPQLLFLHLMGRNMDEAIWKLLRPKH